MNFFKYSSLRLAFSAAAFFASYYLGVGLILAIIFGALIGFAVCYLAFPRLHDAAAADFNRLLKPKKKQSLEEENQALEDQLDEENRQAQGL
ncbi:MAG: hypothetical protein SOR40_04120 [Rothia sp. (in: high G+C Gram-positive bacteria)]|nr:hypothetical protein [Rothia sp. (in: high G+C Gram-positive bacteria)]